MKCESSIDPPRIKVRHEYSSRGERDSQHALVAPKNYARYSLLLFRVPTTLTYLEVQLGYSAAVRIT